MGRTMATGGWAMNRRDIRRVVMLEHCVNSVHTNDRTAYYSEDVDGLKPAKSVVDNLLDVEAASHGWPASVCYELCHICRNL